MTRRSIALMTVAGLMLGGAGSTRMTATVSGLTPASVVAALEQKGRYKQQGNVCEWTANDDGPNQCEPQIKGRFKRGSGDSCTWDANELGTDQCRPAKGRWKGGPNNACAWDPSDSGPDQCNPRRPK
jgi:hypothetical protein